MALPADAGAAEVAQAAHLTQSGYEEVFLQIQAENRAASDEEYAARLVLEEAEIPVVPHERPARRAFELAGRRGQSR